MMIVKDAIHGNILVDEFEKRIMDTADFQRLRRIKQLGVTYLVYPGATHTRFEHSLGTMHMASRICARLGLSGEEEEKVRAYSLLHDIGHTAFSHESEKALSGILGDHEEIGKKRMMRGALKEILLEKFSKKEVLGLGEGIGGIVAGGDVGADRMDYLPRDAHHIGVSYGTVDVDRVVHTLALGKDGLVVGKGGLEAAESLLVGRFMMFSAVYLHKTVRIGSAMLKKAISGALEDGMDSELFLEGTDDCLLEAMLKTKTGGVYARGLLERKLYKLAYSVDGVVDAERAAGELSSECGCDVIVDVPPTDLKKPDMLVRGEKGVEGIMEASDLVKVLFLAGERRKKTLVLCPEGKRKKVEKAASGYFGAK